MAVDCGKELKDHNVAFISIWPGPVKTQESQFMLSAIKGDNAKAIVSLNTVFK